MVVMKYVWTFQLSFFLDFSEDTTYHAITAVLFQIDSQKFNMSQINVVATSCNYNIYHKLNMVVLKLYQIWVNIMSSGALLQVIQEKQIFTTGIMKYCDAEKCRLSRFLCSTEWCCEISFSIPHFRQNDWQSKEG